MTQALLQALLQQAETLPPNEMLELATQLIHLPIPKIPTKSCPAP